MEETKYIAISTFCQHHHIESNLIFSFQELGLVEVIEEKSEFYLEEEKLGQLERMVRLYKDLEISPNGVQVVIDLLHKIEKLQEDNLNLKRRLRKWEE